MGIDIEIRGRYGGRGFFKRTAKSTSFVKDVLDWISAREGSRVISGGVGEGPEAVPTMGVLLHPAAQNLIIASPSPGDVFVSVRTNTVGPGYHAHVCELLHAMESEFGISWQAKRGDDETDFFLDADFDALTKHMNAWLRALCESLLQHSQEGSDYTSLGVCMPVDYTFESERPQEFPFATMLGPRSRAWAEEVLQGSGTFFPWPNREMDGVYLLNIALCQMWTDVRWRKPMNDGEKKLNKMICEILDQVQDNGGAPDMPWREWRELLSLSQHRTKYNDMVASNAATASGPLVGYRRGDVTCRRLPGWSLVVPGELSDEEDGGAWVGHGERRSVRLTTFTINADGGTPAHAEALAANAVRAIDKFGGERLDHAKDGLVGVARFWEESDGGTKLWNLTGFQAADGKLGQLTITVADQSLRSWAEGVWRSLRPDPPAEELTP